MSSSCLMAKSALYTGCFGYRFSSHPHLKWNLIIVYDLWFTSLNWVKINLSISFLIQSRYSGSCKSLLTWGQGMQSLITYTITPLMDYYEKGWLSGSWRGLSMLGHHGGQGLPEGLVQWDLPAVAGPDSQSLFHHPSQKQGRWGVAQRADMWSWTVGGLGELWNKPSRAIRLCFLALTLIPSEKLVQSSATWVFFSFNLI